MPGMPIAGMPVIGKRLRAHKGAVAADDYDAVDSATADIF